MKITYHYEVERKDRIEFIKRYIGFGEDLATTIYISEERKKKWNTPTKSVLTDTGIIKIYALDTGDLITAYIATVSEGTAIYRKCYNVRRCPDWLVDTLYWNKTYHDICP